MINSKIKIYFFYFLLICIFLILLEVLCFIFFSLNLSSVFDWHFDQKAFSQTYKSSSPYGWISSEPMPRPGDYEGKECAVAFGDSFTFGEEVQPNETWENQASPLIGCKISNYGVGGFGLDQALLLYEGTPTQSPLVIIGLYPEMMKRNLAASWIFYGSQKDKPLKPYFITDDENDTLKLVPMPESDSLEAIKAYHRHDLFFNAYNIKFPYSFHIIKAVIIRGRQILSKRIGFLKDPRATELQGKLLTRFRSAIEKNHARPAFLVFPSHIEMIKEEFNYLSQLQEDKALLPSDCVINPGPALHAALKKDEKIFAPAGHLNQQGNLIVAKTVASQFQACQLLK